MFACKALALPANIGLGWKDLPRTNTLAYLENPYITEVKRFIVQAIRSSLVDYASLGQYLKVLEESTCEDDPGS